MMHSLTAKTIGSSTRGPALACLALACLALIFGAAPAPAADFELVPGSFAATSTDDAGNPLTQAGAHPDVTTAFTVETATDRFGSVVPSGDIKDVRVDLPVGLVGNPSVVPWCLPQDFSTLGANPNCAIASQVGTITVSINYFPGEPPTPRLIPVYNLKPAAGQLAQFGFRLGRNNVLITARVRSEDDFGVTAMIHNIPAGTSVFGSSLTLWGVPAAASHDPQRFRPGTETPGDANGEPLPAGVTPEAFFVSPTECAGPPVTKFAATSWQQPTRWVTAQSTTEPTSGCEKLKFAAGVSVESSERTASTPAGLVVDLAFPQPEDQLGLASAQLKDATVTLPPGVTINPPSADGLGACSDEQLQLRSLVPSTCPAAAKIGTVEATTPVLSETLVGGIYLRPQASNDPQSGEMFRLALVLENEARGLSVRLPGQLRVDSGTGQVVATFRDNPRVPISAVHLNFKAGPRASLTTPTRCGTYASTYSLTAWSGAVASGSAPMTIDRGCERIQKFEPSLEAGPLSPIAGAPAPFVMHLSRPDGQQNISGLRLALPEGLLAKLAGVPLCPSAQAVTGACPASSQIGTTTVGVGSGPTPLYLAQPGKDPTAVYLADPYKGAPYSLVVKVPAQAGPFDLGVVVVRAAIRVDRVTARVSVESDPLPRILGGVPIAYRAINVAIDRPDFMRNPTNCEPMSADGQVTSDQGAIAAVSSPIQLGDCASLNFAPRLSLALRGETARGAYPALRAILKAKKGQANIRRVSVALPHSEFLAQEHIRTVCTRVQFAAEACPEGSIYGYAEVTTPLLDQPLRGPVYLRSSSNPLPDLVAALRGQIDIDLAGRIDTVKGGIRTTFAGVPDAPVSKFVLSMKGGKKGLLVNSRNLCKSVNRADVRMTGQNGKAASSRPVVTNPCGKAGEGEKAKRGSGPRSS